MSSLMAMVGMASTSVEGVELGSSGDVSVGLLALTLFLLREGGFVELVFDFVKLL